MTEITEVIIDQDIESGFYSFEYDTLNFAPNFVQWPDKFLIQRSEKDTYEYPVRGYYWFESRAEALEFFAATDPNEDDQIMTDPSMAMFSTAKPNNFNDMISDPYEYATEPDELEYIPDSSKAKTMEIGNPPDAYSPYA